MAASTRAELDESWLLLDFKPEVAGECYTVDIDLQWGTIQPLGRDDGAAAGPDDNTEPEN
jgi:hypothetical protein